MAKEEGTVYGSWPPVIWAAGNDGARFTISTMWRSRNTSGAAKSCWPSRIPTSSSGASPCLSVSVSRK
jgi:hypothetical protein